MGVVTDGMQVTGGAGLGKDAPQGKVRGVRLNSQVQIWLKVVQDWSGREGLLQLMEGCTRCL